MSATYTKGATGDTLIWQGDITVSGAQVFSGDITLGDAVADTTVIKGRLATGSAAGAALSIDATTYQYSEGLELRYAVADWADTYTLTEFSGLYLRAEATEVNASGTLEGAIIYGVANNVGVQHLKGLLSYAYIKGATAKTVATAYGVHAELTWDASADTTTITTEMTPLMSKITGGKADDYTKIHGAIIRAGDMDGTSRTYGNGILIQDDAALAGAITWTKGISIANACTTGISIEGATSFGIEITGSSTVAFDCRTGTFGTGVSVAGTVTTGVFVGGTVTTAISVATSGSPQALSAAANRGLGVYTTSALTSGVSTSATISQVMTGASATNAAEAFRTELTSAVQTGIYANAIVGQLNYSTAGFAQGLGAVICAELDMASTDVNGGKGTYATFESEINLPSGFVSNSVPMSIMYTNVWGTEAAQFDTDGYLFDINGVTKASGKFFQDNNAADATQALRIRVNGTPYYIMLTSTGD